MSGSNPFHRNNRPAGSKTTNPGLQVLNDRPNAGDGLPALRVEVPVSTRFTTATKRVRIASPPVPISPETPASYASSPEETRYASFRGSPSSINSGSVPYAQALASNPFQTSLSDGEREDADEELLENTRKNSTLGSTLEHEMGKGAPDTVKTTLARFASLPCRSPAPPASTSGEQIEHSSGKASRPALDVDAFKRLLLTGVSEVPADQAMSASTHVSLPPAVHSGSSSSIADTASLSQHSIFEPIAPILTDTPRTSQELDSEEAVNKREVLISETTTDKKPPVPRPRHGKPLSKSLTAPPLPITHEVTQVTQTGSAHLPKKNLRTHSPSDLNKPLPPPPIDNSFPQAADPSASDILQGHASIRRPPTPPLTRRQSQRRSQSVQESFDGSRNHPPATQIRVASSVDQEFTVADPTAPPPPPTRRQKRASAVGLQSSESTVQEEGDSYITLTPPQLSPTSSMTSLSQFKPQPPPSRSPSAAKRGTRVSTSSPTMAPPLPPPRRVRGSSRSSFDSQGTVSTHNLDTGNEIRRPSKDSSRNVSGQSPAKDILADLAALQMEVDTLRNKQTLGREAYSTT